jgi:hypothetical protein
VAQVRFLQAQQTKVAAVLQRQVQATAVNSPASALKTWQQAVTIIARVDDEQTTQGGGSVHDRSLAPICGFLHENSKLRRRFNSSNELDGAHYRLSARFCAGQAMWEFFKFIDVTGGADQ